jgi:hypothetical protein
LQQFFNQTSASLPFLKAPPRERNFVRYQNDILGYARDVLQVSLTEDQQRILLSVQNNRRTAAKASHAIGKTFSAAIAACWWYDCWPQHIVYITAPTWDQCLGLTFKQIKQFRLNLGLPGDILDTGLVRDPERKMQPGHFIKALNAQTGEGFQGEHTAPILIIMEEAVGVAGHIWEASDGLMTHPDCIPNGGVVAGSLIEGCSKRWYEGEVIEIRTALGNLTVTENHPVLTDKGWVAAALVQKGDDVFRCADAERMCAVIAPDDYQVPTLIEEIPTAMGRSGEHLQCWGERHQFHGDGRQGKVDIIRAARPLRRGFDPTLLEPREHLRFTRVDLGASLLGERDTAPMLKALPLSARSAMRGGRDGAALFGRKTVVPDPVSLLDGAKLDTEALQTRRGGAGADAVSTRERRGAFASVVTCDENRRVRRNPGLGETSGGTTPARFHTGPLESGVDGHAFHTELGSELLGAFPGLVTRDQVIEVRRRPYRGHVYNLQSRLGWFVCDDYIIKNCRLLCIANPTDEATRFGKACDSSLYHVLTVCAMQHPNILAELRGEEPPFPKAVRLLWLRERLEKECDSADTPEGEAFAYYTLATLDRALSGQPLPPGAPTGYYRPTASFEGRVLGEFPTQATSQVIPKGWLRTLPTDLTGEGKRPEIGCDIARYGEDRTALVVRQGPKVLKLAALRQLDNVEVMARLREEAAWAAAYYNAQGPAEPITAQHVLIKIDVTGGLGTGPFDVLKREGYHVAPCNAASVARDKEQFARLRSEMWWRMRERVREKRLDLSALPQAGNPSPYDLLVHELSTPKYTVDSAGRKLVEPKDDIKKRLDGDSPDLADALNLAFTDVGHWWEDAELLGWLKERSAPAPTPADAPKEAVGPGNLIAGLSP